MRTLLFLSSFTFLILAPGLASAQSLNYFMKIGDIKGESQDAAHKDQVEILSVNFGTNFGVSFGSSGPPQTSNVSPGSVYVTFAGDLKALPKILEGSFKKTNYPKVEIFGALRSGGSGPSNNIDVVGLELTDCLLESVSFAVSDGDVPITEVSIVWTKFKLTTKTLDPETGQPAGDVIVNFNRDAGTAP